MTEQPPEVGMDRIETRAARVVPGEPPRSTPEAEPEMSTGEDS